MTREEERSITAVWQKWRFSAPQTHLWLIKQWFSVSTFVVKIPHFTKPLTLPARLKIPPDMKIIDNFGTILTG
jgi:hypothetical protein